MQIRLAWRNIWRNKRRTLLSVGAMALGAMVIVFGTSFNEAFWGKLIPKITAAQVGHIQIHGDGWQNEPELGNVVKNPDLVEASVSTALPGARPSRRVVGYGLAGSEEQSAAVLIMGIQPTREPSGSGPLTVVGGKDLSPTLAKQVVIGRALAEQLEVGPGSELVMVGQAVDGSVANDRYTIVGIADAGSDELDASVVFLNLTDAQAFFGLGQGVHQVLLRLPTDQEDVSEHVESLRGALDLAELEALSWDQLLPELKNIVDQKRQGQSYIAGIVFLIVGLGVLNAMTMATFERTREFGVMTSLGARRGRVLRLVLAEAMLQGAVGLAIGITLAVLLLMTVGTIDMGATAAGDMAGVRMPTTVELTLNGKAVLNASITILLTVIAGGLWPAWRAARLRPVEATRYV